MQYGKNFTPDLFFFIDVQCDEYGVKYQPIECRMYEPVGETVTTDEALDLEAMWNEAQPIEF